MKTIIIKLISASLGLLMFAGITWAQEVPPSFESGPYTFNLSLMAGYRSLTTAANGENPSDYWAEQRYYEAGNYRTGMTLTSFNLYGEKTAKDGFFDQLFLNANGLGDPFTTASLRMRAFNSYDLKVNFRNAKYFMNRNDSIYTGLHKFDRTRTFLNASLDIDASDMVSFKLSYNSVGRSGEYRTTVSPFVAGGEEFAGPGNTSDGSFGTFARGNFYWMESPLNDQTNEFGLSATLKVDKTTDFTLGGGYRMFSQDWEPEPIDNRSLTYYDSAGTVNWAGVFAGFPNSPKKVAAANVNPLNSFTWTESQESKTPFAFLEAVSKPIKDLSITATFRWEDTKMEGTVDGNMNAIMPRRTGGGLRLLADTTSGHFHNELTSLLGSLVVTGNVTDQLTLNGMYRYSNTDLEVDGVIHKNIGATDTVTSNTYNLLFAGPMDNIVSSKATKHNIEGWVNFLPMNELSLRAGVKFSMRTPEYDREVEGEPDSVSNRNLSRETNSLTPFFNFWYRPIKQVKISGRFSHSNTKVYEHGTTDEADMQIRITPKTTDKYSFGVDVEPIEDMDINLHYQGMSGSSDLLNMIPTVINDPKLEVEMQSVGASVRYQIVEEVGISLTGEYRTNDFAIPATWTRGQFIPDSAGFRIYGDSMTISVEQHLKDLFIDASVTIKPIKELNILLGYSMIDSKEGNFVTPYVRQNFAEDLIRIGGPYTWNLLHAQASYDITPNVGIQVDFQMASQKETKEEDYTAVVNNYKATLIRGSVYFHL